MPSRREPEAIDALAKNGRPLARRLVLNEGVSLIEGRAGGLEPQTECGSLRANGGHGPLAIRLFGRIGAHLRLSQGAIA